MNNEFYPLSHRKIVYEIALTILAVISVIFSIMDINNGLSDTLSILDGIIYVIFIMDYVVRFCISSSKKIFFKDNIFDLIAILPFSSALRIFRSAKMFRLFRIAKLAKFARLFALSGRMLSRCKTFLNTNGFKYMLLFSTILIVIGGALISFFENMKLVDGIWWAFVTATTVGYGDISPATTYGRIVACILMISGIGLIGSLTSTITTFFICSGKSEETISNDRIYMVHKLYGELNDSEKEIFRNRINGK